MRRFFRNWWAALGRQLFLDEPAPDLGRARYFCATCTVAEGTVHRDWCHRIGVMVAQRLLPPGPDLVDYITAEQVARELGVQARLPRDSRDPDLIAFLLDMRTALGPPPTGSELLPVRLRYHVPVIPGGAS